MKKEKEITINNLNDLESLASELVTTFKGGELILCSGDLGVGKTALAKFIGKKLNINTIINSPTFNILKIYHSDPFNFNHLDCYRLENSDNENIYLDLLDILSDPKNITFVEWPELLKGKFNKDTPIIRISIEYADRNKRKVVVLDERK